MKNKILALLALLTLSTGVSAYDRIPVPLPACDISNPKVFIIEDDAGMEELDNPLFNIFCLKPGNYSKWPIRIWSSGTAEEPRYLIHADAPTTHPALMDEADRAVIKGLNFMGQDHWVIDHITIRNTFEFKEIVNMLPKDGGADHITLNKVVVEGGGGAGLVNMGGHDLLVQDSVIRDSYDFIAGKDNNGIVFRGHNNKAIGNEIYNVAGDSILVTGILDGANTGSVIADNEMYVTNAMWTDGAGNFDPVNGTWLCAENATDFKAGGTEASPLIYTGNKVWGFDRNDDHACVSGGGGEYPLSLHFDARYIEMNNNIFYKHHNAIIFTAALSHHINIVDNLFWDMEYVTSAPHHKTNTNTWINNKFEDIRTSFWYEPEPDLVNNEISGNIPLEGEVCWTQHQITNPTQVCVTGSGATAPPPPPPPVVDDQAIIDAATLFKLHWNEAETARQLLFDLLN